MVEACTEDSCVICGKIPAFIIDGAPTCSSCWKGLKHLDAYQNVNIICIARPIDDE